MNCLRCHGLLVVSEYHDHERVFLGTRCINCGDILDHQIVSNRQHPPVKGWADTVYRVNPGVESAYDRRH